MAAIQRIYAHYVRETRSNYEEQVPDVAEMERRRAQITKGGFPFIVAEWDGRLVGYAYAASFRPRPGYRYTIENSIYVDATLHGQGLGGALLDRLITLCAAAGFRQMVAVIGDRENQASIALHEKCGFAHVGVMPGTGYKLGQWVDTVIMQRPLGDGDGSAPE